MKIINATLLLCGMALAMPTAFAAPTHTLPPIYPPPGGCTYLTCYRSCNPAVAVSYCQGSTNTSTNTNSQGQSQGQGQTATGGNAASSASNSAKSSAANSGGNSAVTVDTGSRAANSGNDNSRVSFIPPVVPGTPSSVSAAGDLHVFVTACGPKLVSAPTPVQGSYMGFFGTSKVDLGSDDQIQQATLGGMPSRYDETRDQDGTIHQEGSQAVITSAIVNVSGARNLALGGGSGGGSWGQAGGGSSSSMTRIVTSVQIIPCDHAYAPAQPSVVYVPVESPAPVEHRRYLVKTCHPVGIRSCPEE